MFQIARLILTLITIVYIFIFVGMVFQGVIDMRSMITIGDHLYTFAFLLLGGILTTIGILQIKYLFTKNAQEKYLAHWRKQSTAMVMAILLFIVMYIFRNDIRSLILFAGFEIGRFFIQTARLAYLKLFGFDLNNIHFYQFAWFFQLHFVFSAAQLVMGIVNKWILKRAP